MGWTNDQWKKVKIISFCRNSWVLHLVHSSHVWLLPTYEWSLISLNNFVEFALLHFRHKEVRVVNLAFTLPRFQWLSIIVYMVYLCECAQILWHRMWLWWKVTLLKIKTTENKEMPNSILLSANIALVMCTAIRTEQAWTKLLKK